MRSLEPTEHQSQACFVDWLRLKRIWHYAVPNGAYLGSDPRGRAIQMQKLKAEGFSSGVPDMVIPYRTTEYGGLYCEMKRKGKRVEPEQTEWHEFLRGQGYAVHVCYSADEAIAATMHYFAGVPK
jgi:hypothetical protein